MKLSLQEVNICLHKCLVKGSDLFEGFVSNHTLDQLVVHVWRSNWISGTNERLNAMNKILFGITFQHYSLGLDCKTCLQLIILSYMLWEECTGSGS